MTKKPLLSRSDSVALELGRISLSWSSIEQLFDYLVILMAEIPDEDAANAICANIDLRGKAQIAKAIVFKSTLDSEWKAVTLKLINEIDNEIRTKRNLYIHSEWVFVRNTSHMRVKKVRFVRPQAFQMELSTETRVRMRIGQLRRFTRTIDRAAEILGMLFMYFVKVLNDRHHSLPEISLEQYLRLPIFVDNPTHAYLRQLRRRAPVSK